MTTWCGRHYLSPGYWIERGYEACDHHGRLAEPTAGTSDPPADDRRRAFDPDDIPVADGYSRDDFGTDDEVRGWNLCREYVIDMVRGNNDV